nr:hypothetical protein [Nonomuraea antri]
MADDGFLVYRWEGENLRVDSLVAGSEETTRALWSMVGSSSSIAKNVVAHVAPDDPVLWLLRERSIDQVKQQRWMFRVLDVAAAAERRGYPVGVAADVPLTVDGEGWRLEFGGGSGAATRAGAGADGPSLGIGGFSALYAGVPASTLRLTGLMSGNDRYDEVLDSAFAAKPYMLDYF